MPRNLADRYNALWEAKIEQWNRERQRLVAALARGTDGTGWTLSPEAKDNLRKDIAECDRTLRRLKGGSR